MLPPHHPGEGEGAEHSPSSHAALTVSPHQPHLSRDLMEEGGLLGHRYEQRRKARSTCHPVWHRGPKSYGTPVPVAARQGPHPAPNPRPNCPWTPLTMSSARSRVARMMRRQTNGVKRVNQGRVEISGMPWQRGWVMPGRQYRTTIPNSAPNRVLLPSHPAPQPGILCPTCRPPGLQASHLPLQTLGQLPLYFLFSRQTPLPPMPAPTSSSRKPHQPKSAPSSEPWLYYFPPCNPVPPSHPSGLSSQ